jgi:hypothetical protein
MDDLLPVGTVVTVTEPETDVLDGRIYVAKVVGYDMGRTKYELGARYAGWSGWKFTDGGCWASPAWVTPCDED